ncbi:MAG: hypothetical protein MUE82_08670 [Chloroflexi bacterium]|jgi:hypothetical protein|nr:hypothetical protein [Chloroflexota bacterium]
MDDLLASVAAVGPPLVLLAIGIALLAGVGPHDWSLVLPRWEPPWPHGVQEEEPHPWDFSCVRPRGGAQAGVPGGTAAGVRGVADDGHGVGPATAAAPDDPPVRLARVRASPRGRWRPGGA